MFESIVFITLDARRTFSEASTQPAWYQEAGTRLGKSLIPHGAWLTLTKSMCIATWNLGITQIPLQELQRNRVLDCRIPSTELFLISPTQKSHFAKKGTLLLLLLFSGIYVIISSLVKSPCQTIDFDAYLNFKYDFFSVFKSFNSITFWKKCHSNSNFSVSDI